MGIISKICYAALGFTIGASMSYGLSCGSRYQIITLQNRSYVWDHKNHLQRELYDGLKLGTLDERVADLFKTSDDELQDLIRAVEKEKKKEK